MQYQTTLSDYQVAIEKAYRGMPDDLLQSCAVMLEGIFSGFGGFTHPITKGTDWQGVYEWLTAVATHNPDNIVIHFHNFEAAQHFAVISGGTLLG